MLTADSSLRRYLVIGAIVLALAAPWVSSSPYSIVLLNVALIYTVVVLGLNFIYGFGGVFSLAQAAFWGIGAYASGLLTTDYHMPFIVGLLGAALVTSLFGVLLGLPTLRLRSHYLTMATLAFAEAVRLILMNAEGLTHGAHGVRGIPPASLGPLVADSPYKFYYLSLAIVLASLLFSVRFRRSRMGRALEAIRDDELSAGSSGVDVTYCRVLAFVLSAFFAGIGGSLWAHYSAFISPEGFDLQATIRFVAMLLIGGAGTAIGPVVGAVLLTYLPEWLRFLEAWYMAIYGLSIVLILIFAPRGLVGVAERLLMKVVGGRGVVGQGGRHQPVMPDGLRPHPNPLPEGEGMGGPSPSAVLHDERAKGEGGVPNPLSLWERARVRALPGTPAIPPTPTADTGTALPGTPTSTPAPAAPTDAAAPAPVLETRGLTIAFGGLVAVREVDLKVEPGEIRGIIGPNGSGKTTILNLISGIYGPTSGQILLAGERVDGSKPSVLVQKGIARTFQNIRLFPQLTVLDNVKVARYCRTHSGLVGSFLATPSTVAEERHVDRDAMAALEFVGLSDRAMDRPGDLPYGQQRLVEIARALATDPRLLLLDEPAAGMSLGEKQRLVKLVRQINADRGIAIIVIEHDMRIISGLCHRLTVLNFGETIADGLPREVREQESVIEAYLGRRSRIGARSR